jgi:hypothetical protein
VRAGDWLVFFSDGVSAGFLNQVAFIQQKKQTSAESLAEVKQLFETQVFHDNASISLAIF